MPLTPEQVREHIPLTAKYIYLDNCATTPVPKPVVEAMLEYFYDYCANVERGAYSIASLANEKWDLARARAAELLLRCEPGEFIFTRNTTEAICMFAYALEHPLLNRVKGRFGEQEPLVKWEKGDNIVFSELEHHSNMMPWIRLARHVGAEIRVVPFNIKTGQIEPAEVEKAVDERTKVLAIQHVSNVTGVIHPVEEFVRIAKEANPDCLVIIDGSQGPGHMPVDVKRIGCDAYAFSGHKGPLGPQGSGGLYVRYELLERMEPMEIGGGTIADVTTHDYELRGDVLCKRWEAGTPSIACLIGLGRAAEYVAEEIGLERIRRREEELTEQFIEGLLDIPGVEVYGETDDMSIKAGVVSFNLRGWDSRDVSLALDAEFKPPILVRAGHHCAIPACRALGVYERYGGTVRASFHYYNTPEEIDTVLRAIRKLARA
ncbi:cysteine desulfurase [Candidatus Bathyarchaeota archaeon]|nr:MAG: cysteine desulfurase [Candidatus Bathyarchaeota archaeon]